MERRGREGRRSLGSRILFFATFASFALAAALTAQQPVSRLKGRVLDEHGKPLKDAEMRAEAFFGSPAGTFAGQRTFTTKSNDKGEWNILGIAPGIWLFEPVAAGHLPESVAVPLRL